MSKRLTTEEFIKRAKEIHGDKYDYSKANYVNSSTPIEIICPEHGFFWQTPSKHIYRGHGCEKCNRREAANKIRYSQEKIIELFHKTHGDKYDYSKVKYINIKEKVCIICQDHGEFWQTPQCHILGQGCPICGVMKSRNSCLGVSFIDYNIRTKEDFYIYSRWSAILQRCYKPFGESTKCNYSNCEMCEEWKYFPNFKKWFIDNNIEGWEIDKDVLFKGNKIYSPDTCCFLPKEVNNFFTIKERTKKENLPIGVFKQGKRFFVINKGDKTFFDSKDEAFDFYIKTKNSSARQLAEKYNGLIDDRIYDILINFDIKEYTK